jgi:hypothetical protein
MKSDLEEVTGPQDDGKRGEKFAPFNPSNIVVVEKAIKMLNLRDNDIVYDLGCGDARFLVEVSRLIILILIC